MTPMPRPSPTVPIRWLPFVRLIWIGLALIGVSMIIADAPHILDPQSVVCAPPETLCFRNLITADEVPLLPQIGLTLTSYNLIGVVFQYWLVAASWLGLSALIFWRKSDEWMAVFTAWFMIGFPLAILTGNVDLQNPAFVVFGSILRWFNGILPVLFFFFPNGHFVPRWTRWVAVAFAISHTLNSIWILMIIVTKSPEPEGLTVFNLIYFGAFFLSVGCQAYRYWKVSTVDERRQTKWIFISILTLPGLDLLLRELMTWLFPQWHQPGLAHIIYNLIADPLLAAGFWLVPIAFAVAIFRYRLYAIDLIIRRTVVWAVISGLGLAIYLLAVGATSFFLGSQPDYVIPLVALIIVAFMARPLYQRLERVMERVMPLHSKHGNESEADL